MTLDLIREAVAGAIRDTFTPDAVTDFLASVVWSNSQDADASIKDLLLTLEHWDTEFAEKDLSEADYKDRLLSVLSGAYPVAV